METQSPKRIPLFEFEGGYAVADFYVNDQKVVIHSFQANEDKPVSYLKEWKQYSDLVDEAFSSRGFDELYTWAITEEQIRYNFFLGYDLTGKEVILHGWEGPPIYEFRKEL